MKVLNYGSLNYDYVYAVDHMVQAGETLSSASMETHFGGKGLNQSIALARAGAQTCHAGMVGEDGRDLMAVCKESGVNTDYISLHEGRSGHAVIQINSQGENCILLFRGANGKNSEKKIKEVLSHFERGDVLLMQNEVNLPEEIIREAFERGMKIALNPSPMDERILGCSLDKVSLFLLNEVEGRQLTGQTGIEGMAGKLREMYPRAEIVMTAGKRGCIYSGEKGSFSCASFTVDAVDTTAAGDTFTGYYIASMLQGKSVEECLRTASAAAAIAVTRKGAVPSIPQREEVEVFLEAHSG